METSQVLRLLAQHPQVKALSEAIRKPRFRSFHVGGLRCSSAPLAFAALTQRRAALPNLLFVLDDADEAGYFYHDLVQMLGEEQVLFFPSSYRRAIKYNQKDAANEILRTEVLSRMASTSEQSLYIVSYPEALAEKVVSKNELSENTIPVLKGSSLDFKQLEERLDELGFVRVDYVYEPGQYAIRGSIVDIYSFSSEMPYRLDFFGDEVESIRTFDVQTQLSEEFVDEMVVVPEITKAEFDYIPVMDFLPEDTVLVTKNLAYVCDRVEQTYREGYAAQAVLEDQALNLPEYERDDMLGGFGKSFHQKVVEPEVFQRGIAKMKRIDLVGRGEKEGSSIDFDISAQPLFHKNFDLLTQEWFLG